MKAVDRVDDSVRNYIKGILARISLGKNEFKKAVILARSAEFGVWLPNDFRLVFEALLSLMNAQPERAIALATEALSQSRKEGIGSIIFSAHLIMASAYCSLGDKKRAKILIERSLHFFNKNNLIREKTIFSILHTFVAKVNSICSMTPPEKHTLPTIKLVLLIKNRKYLQAISYAKKKYLMHYFYNYIFITAEKIKEFVEKGKKTGLPKTILRLPVFNKEIPVYHIKFLGNVIVYKNQKYLKTKLRPKDYAFLIYLYQKAMEPKRSIDLNEVYRNFWPNSEKASRNFSHLLLRVKKALKIPSHLLTVSRSYGESSLINEGIYFTTDYQEFEQSLARAKALQRAGEWKFAKKEFLQAFKLFRGEPFKKNFDEWSVNMRFKILTELETEAINFAQACLEHGNKRDAKRVLEKVLKIIPDSEELQKMRGEKLVLYYKS
uniref:Bacterial transcriptional activator domain-containing protein n=1 Tax=candidate division WOR-3 bacterium TaxID=2052148 RepID=A0A7V0Z685_UNCW3